MRMLGGLLLLAAACALGAIGGYLVRGTFTSAPPRSAGGGPSAQESNAAARIELARLRAENEELAARLADIVRREEERAAIEAAPQPAVAKPARKALQTPLKLKSVEEADALFADALARTDLETVLRLAAALLAMGEEGYEKLLALVTEFGKAVREDEMLRVVCGDERNAGLVLHYAADNVESLLKLGLYLQSRGADGLSEEARFLRDQFDADVGRVLLGFYGGGNAEIDDGIMEVYTRKIASALEGGGGLESREVEAAIRGLSMLKSERATETLVGLAENAPPDVLRKILLGLVFQGTPRAMAAVRTLTAGARSAKQDEALESLLKRRQGGAEE